MPVRTNIFTPLARAARMVSPATVLALTGLAYAIDSAAPANSAAVRQAVEATFVATDDGIGNQIKTPDGPAKPPRQIGRWDRPRPVVPDRLRDAAFPSYYIAGGKAIELRLDSRRIVVRSDMIKGLDGAAAITRELAAAGNAVAKVMPLGSRPWAVVELAQPQPDAANVNAVIEMILARPAIAFAGPVFDNPEIAGGHYAPSDRINIRVREASLADADEAIRRAAPELAVVNANYGRLPGARQLETASRNGFDALRRALELGEHPDIAWASPNAIQSIDFFYTPNDQFFSQLWGWEQPSDLDIDAEAAWDLIRGRSSIQVLVMDSGGDQTHPDMNQNAGRDFTTGEVDGSGNGSPSNVCDNHGTAVAGVISARINNSLGGAGIAPNCRVLAAKIADSVVDSPCGNGWSFTSDMIVNALMWGEDQGARITNSSFGVAENDDLTDAYFDTWINDTLHFGAAGNGGDDSIGDATISYPARLSPEVQAVANLQANGTLNPSSNFGTGLEFACPGTGLISTDRQGAAGYSPTDYTFFNGTSAASPFAAGVAALIWSAFPHYTAGQVAASMQLSATDLGANGYDTTYGYGLPNLYDSLLEGFPNNKWCHLATEITSWNHSITPYGTVNASSSPDEPQEDCEAGNAGVGHSVWYKFTPTCPGTLNLNTNGSSYDTVLSVWLGSCDGTLYAACDDDSGDGLNSQITGLPGIPDVTYYFKIGAYGENLGGLLNFNLLFTPQAPYHDECADARVIPTGFTEYYDSDCTHAATTTLCDGAESCASGGAAGGGSSHSVWYEFTPPTNGKGNAETNGSDYDTVMSVWDGCRVNLAPGICLPPSQLLCDNDSGPGASAQFVGMPMKKGKTYRIKVAQNVAGVGNGGHLRFHFIFQPCPADFNLSGAVTVQDLFDFLGGFFAGDREADFNGEGGISVQDLFDYLAAFFDSPC